jgi:hypothetical protein
MSRQFGASSAKDCTILTYRHPSLVSRRGEIARLLPRQVMRALLPVRDYDIMKAQIVAAASLRTDLLQQREATVTAVAGGEETIREMIEFHRSQVAAHKKMIDKLTLRLPQVR